jgi:hypothetical protein
LGVADRKQRAVYGPATRLTVTVKSPATPHKLTMAKLESWLGVPNYQRPVGRVATGDAQQQAEFKD